MGISANHKADFYLGALAPQGFISRYAQSYNIDDYEYICILKGFPGKNDFVREVAKQVSPYDSELEYIHSCFNPESLDGIIFHTLHAAVIDGTAPHTLEPRYYDAFETILPLGDYCDKDLIRKSRTEIRGLTDRNQQLCERCTRFVSAASSLLSDTYSLALACTDADKAAAFAARVLARESKQSNTSKKGKQRHRFLSAVTPDGITVFDKTVDHYCEKVYVLEDDFGAAANLILTKLRDGFTECGYDSICCWCPVLPFEKLEHLIIPELSIGFVTSNRWHSVDFEGARGIHSRRFTSLEKLAVRRQRISFNRRATNELIDAAASVLVQSQDIHSQLESIYHNAVDQHKLREAASATAKSILALQKTA